MSAHTLAALYIGGVLVVGYFLHRAGKERAKERRATKAIERDMPLWPDYCAHVAARDLDEEWRRLSTLACRDWPDGDLS